MWEQRIMTRRYCFDIFYDQPLHIDDIRKSASLPITAVSSMLTILELKGKVKQVGCKHYVRMQERTAIYGN